jgi:hypothetical protein
MTSNRQKASLRVRAGRWAERALIGVLGISAVVYLGDWAIFALRSNPQDQVVVTNYLTVPLKGNKTEFDYQGTQTVPCARAIFSQEGLTPCWYLRRHTSQEHKI